MIRFILLAFPPGRNDPFNILKMVIGSVAFLAKHI